MKTSFTKKIILGALIISSTMTYAQKKNTTNAAMAYGRAEKALYAKNGDLAVTELLLAKKSIDLAAAHADTKSDPKTLKYKGMIYIDLIKLGMMQGNETVKAMDLEKITEEGIAALKSSKENDSKGRYTDDVDDYCKRNIQQGYGIGSSMFSEKKYEEAMAGFGMAATFSDAMGVTDSAAYFYTGISAFNIEKWEVVEETFEKCVEIGYKPGSSASYLAEAYSKLDKTEKAEEMLKEQMVKHPGNKDIMIALINNYLAQDKKIEAEKVLTEAIANDPNNKDLHYATATVYENLERYKDAEAAYKKVLEIDPKYTGALVGLGTVYYNQAVELNTQIGNLDIGDPKEETLQKEMLENFKKSLPYLQKADEIQPNNKEILTSLKHVYYKLEMMAEFKATKAKIAELQ